MLRAFLRHSVASLALLHTACWADCLLTHPKPRTGEEAGRSWQVEDVVLANDLVSYTLRTEFFIAQDDPNAILPKKWAPTIGYTPLGIAGPSMALWYNQGFMQWTFDDMNLLHYRPHLRVIRDAGPDTVVEYTWDTPKATVSMRFGIVQGNDKLVLLARWQPKGELKQVKLRLMAYPGTFSKPHNRRATTALGTRESGSSPLDLAREKWVLLEDTTEGRPADGSAGVLLGDTSAFSAASLDGIGGYGEYVSLVLAPGRNECALAFYEFPEQPDHEQTRACFRKGADAESLALGELLAGDPAKPWVLPAGDQNRIGELLAQRAERRAKLLARPAETWSAASPDGPDAFPWFRSLAGGPVRIALLCPRQAAWETTRLAARIALDVRHQYFDTATALVSANSWPYRGQTGIGPLPAGLASRNASEICGAPDREVILISQISGEAIPQRVQRDILESVRGGKTLYLAGEPGMLKGWPAELTATPDDALVAPVLSAFPWESIPGLRPDERGRADAGPPLRAYRYGNGRVVFWRTRVGRYSAFSPLSDASEGLDGAFDRILALNAAGLLAAANRPLPVRLKVLPPTPDGNPLRIDVSGPRPERLVLRVQDTMDRIVFSGQFAPGVLPALPTGADYFAEVTALDPQGRTLGVAASSFAVEGGCRVESIEITPSRQIHEPGVPVVDLPEGGNITVRATVADVEGAAGLVAEASVFDAFDRLMAKASAPALAGTRITLHLSRPVAICHRLEIAIRQGDQVLARARQRFTVPIPYPYDDFTYLLWSYARGEPVTRFVQRRCYELGTDMMDLCHMRGYSDAQAAREYEVAARSNLRLIPYVTRVALSAQEDGTLKPGLFDQEWLDTQRNSMVPCTRQAVPYAPPAYTLGDENYLSRAKHEAGGSPETMAAFRVWLKAKYGTIDRLNQTWDSTYPTFDAIAKPMWLAEAARQARSYSAWFDHREFLDTAFVGLHERLANIIREQHPGAKVGWDGPLNYHWQAGYDFWKWTRNLELNQVYTSHPLQGDLVRSFARPDSLRGEWGNAIADNEDGFRGIAWFNLFRQHNSCWWWTSWGCDYIPFNPDGTVSLFGEWFFDEARELRGGIGKLLLHARRDDSGIAILYSQADMFAARLREQIVPGTPYSAWRKNLADSAELIRHPGFQFRYLDRTQLTAAGLAQTKLLVLPGATCLSDQQVAAIRAFVQGGGVVLADGRTGLLTENGAIRPRRPLNDVFGIELEGGIAAFTQPGARQGETTTVEPGETFLAHRFGKGLAMRINLSFTDLLADLREDRTQAAAVELVQAFDAAGLVPPAVCAEWPVAMEQIQFQDGPSRYLAFQRSIHLRDPATWQSQVDTRRPSYVYDIRAGALVAEEPTSTWEVSVSRGHPAVYALLPYRVGKLALELGGVAKRGQTLVGTIRLQADGAPIGYHVVHAAVFAPNTDTEHRQYSRNVACAAGTGTFSIPFALSDAPGEWRVVCRDAATGVRTTASVRLQ